MAQTSKDSHEARFECEELFAQALFEILDVNVIPWGISVSRVVAELHQRIRPFLELADLGSLKGNGGNIDFAAARACVVLLVENGCKLSCCTYLLLDHKVDGSKFTVPYGANY
jgi:hypothetical protein